MPVTPTYPGLYIEELPSSSNTITAAATSITVFVGYTHPYQTESDNWNKAIQIFSFTDYEREFGGLYTSGIFPSDVPNAVNQFFLNGGSNAYVVALQPQYRGATNNDLPSPDPVDSTLLTARPSFDTSSIKMGANPAGSIKFIAIQPTDQISMTVTISNIRTGTVTGFVADDTADITVAYGPRTETYRGVSLNSNDAANFIDNRINPNPNTGSSGSALIRTVPAGTSATPVYAAPFVLPVLVNQALSLTATLPTGFTTVYSASDFTSVFQQDTSLDKLPGFNLLLTPGVADNTVWSSALSFAETKLAFVILDPPAQASADGQTTPAIASLMNSVPLSTNGALYFPYLKSTDILTGNEIEVAPSGYVAGIYASTDLNRGVWKAPAGFATTLLNTTGVVDRGLMSDMRQGTLNPIGVNCIREFPAAGTIVFGARTLVTANPAQQQWRYVPVRRTALFIEQTLLSNLGWVVFEPNDTPLWVAIRMSIEAFMTTLYQQGAFQGSTPDSAFQVKVDSTTTTPADVANGIVNIVVAFAPLKPAEFVGIQIAQLAGQTQ